MSLNADRPYPIADPVSALRYASGRAEFSPGKWVYVKTGDGYRLRCAWCVTEEGHELAVSRPDRMPDEGDLSVVRQALRRTPLVEVGTPAQVHSRKTVILTLEKE